MTYVYVSVDPAGIRFARVSKERWVSHLYKFSLKRVLFFYHLYSLRPYYRRSDALTFVWVRGRSSFGEIGGD